MRKLGMVAAAIMGAFAVSAVVVGARSIPDVRRYLAMRRM
jgi:hypothetical protein